MTGTEDLFISDLGSSLTDLEIMEKYRISATDLRRRLFTLIREGAVSSRDVYWRPILYDYEVEHGDKRFAPRYPLKRLLPVYSVDCPQLKPGLLIDINEKGGCVMGLGVRPGERITIAVHTEDLLDAKDIRMEAFFKWIEPGEDFDILAAGFEIFTIAPTDFVLLKELIREVIAKS
jgi:hypothetical protein